MIIIRKITPIVLAVLSLATAVNQLTSTYFSGEWKNQTEEMVSKWDDRIQPLQEALPSGLEQVGYMDNSIISGDSASFDVHEFQLMQYSLAPIPLQMGIDQEWIVGNFNDDGSIEPWLDEHFGTYDIQGFGFGLYLIHDLEN